MSETCQAALPIVELGAVQLWEICGLPADARTLYSCACGHVRERVTCPVHEPQEGQVGCQLCLEDGHECGMAFEFVGLVR